MSRTRSCSATAQRKLRVSQRGLHLPDGDATTRSVVQQRGVRRNLGGEQKPMEGRVPGSHFGVNILLFGAGSKHAFRCMWAGVQ